MRAGRDQEPVGELTHRAEGANRIWLLASSVALNILAMLSDLAFGPDPDERLPRRRQAKYLRRMLL